jgi:hypothetical protein
MLSPITEMAVDAVSRPVTLANMALERDMDGTFLGWEERDGSEPRTQGSC